MNKTAILLSVSLVVQLGASGPADAIQRKHKPWMMARSRQEPPPIPESDVIVGPVKIKGMDVGKRVAHRALDYKGTRYRFGGTTKKGLDCSGLVSRVWEDLKMKKIPRASASLYNSGRPVHLAELQAGDLVFFKNTYKRGISHVGVYAGNNKFVHAANHSKGVTITKLSDPYYQLHYAGARRLY